MFRVLLIFFLSKKLENIAKTKDTLVGKKANRTAFAAKRCAH